MSFDYDNDVEDLLEKSIDEKYSQNKSKSGNKCPFNYNQKSKPKYSHPKVNRKVFTVEEKVKFNSLLLPDGWVRLFHDSGMFFYCHAASRVVTWAMPYQLHTEPHRYHRVPVRALPCLSFRLASNLDSDLFSEAAAATTAETAENGKLESDAGNVTESALDPTEPHNDHSHKTDTEKSINLKKEDDRSPPLLPPESSGASQQANGAQQKHASRSNQSFLQDIEEGEIESSDDDKPARDIDLAPSDGAPRSKPTTGEDSGLPKQYQIDGDSITRRGKHPAARAKQWHSSSGGDSQRQRDRSRSGDSPAKRRKVMSASGAEPAEPPHSPSKPDPAPDAPDLSAKLLDPDQMRRYCQRLFTFVEEARYFPRFCFFKKRLNRPNNSANAGAAGTAGGGARPAPAGGKVLDVAGNNANNSSGTVVNDISVSIHCTERLKIPNKNIYIELAGRNFNCVLNMYCQNAFGITPTFKASSSLSGIHDFEVTCDIGGTSYAVGEGKTKKIAKQRAVTKTLEILVPGFFNMIQSGCADKSSSLLSIIDGTNINTSGNNNSSGGQGGNSSLANITGSNQNSADANGHEIYSIFDHMDITDPRVFSYTTKLNSIAPYNMLLECMNRHCVLDSHLVSTISKSNSHNVYKMKLGDKEVQANCENKREGRQLASQYMLAKLHPHIQRWGGILRLYGPDSKPVKRFDMHEMQNLLLEDRGGVKSNLINLLRRKMLELNEEWQSSNKTYAKFKVPFENIPIIVFHPDSKDQAKQ